ncbi:MAG: DUF814 domain-containing protein, partial [Planctomycetes bacterium]|nr:DUF814 domain-containing protein [Planctomycetota bacterium]
IANGNDWFLHIASFPGAHVIVRNQKGQTPPLETLLDAAQLCLHYSKMKKALAASVHYVQAKFVRKPKGAKPGLVLVHGGKEISIRKDDERLARLLKRDHF